MYCTRKATRPTSSGPRPRTQPAGRPRVLLATIPRTIEELAERGVWFQLEVAAALPAVEIFALTWPWRSGESAATAVRARLREARIGNVQLLDGAGTDMPALHASMDFTVIPYISATGGKECPRSLIESMACGVPVLISGCAPFSQFIEASGCGAAFAQHVAATTPSIPPWPEP